MKRVLYSSVVLSLVWFSSVVAVWEPPQIQGEYAGDFNTCYQANLNGAARSIEDFVCVDRAGNWQQMLSQIVLDRKFSEIDEEALEYIKELEEAKWEYFGPDANESFLTAADAIESTFAEYGYYWDKFKELCQEEILGDIAEASDGVANIEAKKYLWWDDRNACLNLARTKLSIYREVSYDILKLNKIEVREDEKREFVQEEREKNDIVLDSMREITGNTERLLNGWPTKTKETALFIIDMVKSYLV